MSAQPALGQIPDSLQVVDSLQVLDSLMADSTGLQEAPDSVSADTIFYNLPRAAPRTPAGFATGVWDWDRAAILASGAMTLAELVQDVPGVTALYGGDYGTPLSMTAFASGAGGYRVLRDGLELYPLEGGVVDLQRVSLVGITRVRLDRSMGRMTLELWSHAFDDGRPLSVVEAGTGDLSTNMFRGMYADPVSLGGSLVLGLERADTRSRGQNEGGSRVGSWVRYQLHRGDRGGLSLDFRRTGSQTKVPIYTSSGGRTDVALQGAWRVRPGLVVEGFTGRSTFDEEAPVDPWAFRGGRRTQLGGRVSWDVGPGWVRAGMRSVSGDLPAGSSDLSVGGNDERVGGFSAGMNRENWAGEATSSVGFRVWTAPVLGLQLFGSYEDGSFGARTAAVADLGALPPRLQPDDIVQGPHGLVDRTTWRAGASITAGGVHLAAARLHLETDSLRPLGTELDFGANAVVGTEMSGYEANLTAPMPFAPEGFFLTGSYQGWDQGVPYLPKQIYRGAIVFERVFKETRNLEFRSALGVRGHDPMTTFVADDGTGLGGVADVPFFQNWYWRIQIRVVSVRLFFGWDNVTFRRRNQTYPDRTLPYARSFFGLHWDLWN